jgi:amino acid transporter
MSTVSPMAEDGVVDSDIDTDESALMHLGYKQELKRSMDIYMSFSIGFTEVSALISVTSIFAYGLSTGGPILMVWGWLLTFIMSMIIAYNFAEICSVYPVAG